MARLNPRMTLDDVLNDMRSKGMPMSKKTLCDCLRQGVFPFAHTISTGTNGRNNYLIMRRDYEIWANEYLGGD